MLHDLFSGLGSSSAYVLGDALNGMQWHVYVAGAAPAHAAAPAPTPVHTLEVCMTGLCPTKAAQFVRTPAFVSSQHTTATCGIADLVPTHTIDDYVFEPCGYSMNGTSGAEFSTIHITPEDGFSYASFELCGYAPDAVAASELVTRVAAIFEPKSISVAMSADTVTPGADSPGWGAVFGTPAGYECHSASHQEVKCGGYVAFFTLEKQVPAGNATAALAGLALGKAGTDCGSESSGGSPRGVLKHFPSLKAIHATASVPADIELMAASSDNSSDCGLMGPERPLDGPLALAVDDVAAVHGAVPLPKGDQATIEAHIRALIDRHGLEDNFYVVDLGALQRLYHAWGEAMPRVHPHYAVKCNNDPALLATLAALGAGFDCASEAEVEQVTAMGVSPDRIIFANPCKRPADIRSAARKGVVHSTFDTGELSLLLSQI